MRTIRISHEDRKQIISRLLQGISIKNIVLSYKHRHGAKIRRQFGICWSTTTRLAPLRPYQRMEATKLTCGVMNVIESIMQADDETTALELVENLQGLGISMSRHSVLKGHWSMGWSHQGSAYCQLIRDVNKHKCHVWALALRSDTFHDVIWSDETTVQLECHCRFCCRKQEQKPRYKPRPKYPTEVHVWMAAQRSVFLMG